MKDLSGRLTFITAGNTTPIHVSRLDSRLDLKRVFQPVLNSKSPNLKGVQVLVVKMVAIIWDGHASKPYSVDSVPLLEY
jgi:hypothetical protein